MKLKNIYKVNTEGTLLFQRLLKNKTNVRLQQYSYYLIFLVHPILHCEEQNPLFSEVNFKALTIRDWTLEGIKLKPVL